MQKVIVENKIRQSRQDRVFDAINLILMILLLFIFIWPLWFVLIASFSDPMRVLNGEVLILPVDFNVSAYKELIRRGDIWLSYLNSIFYTVAGTALNMVFTVCAAYPLSRKTFVIRNYVMTFFLITMYFSGGLIPLYVLLRGLHLIDSRLCLILGGAISVYNMLIVRNYFMNSIPSALREASMLDGANSAQDLIHVVLPLSKPVLAVVTLYYAVGHWNDYYSALVYITSPNKYPLQLVLRDILSNVTVSSESASTIEDKVRLAQTLKYSSIIAAMIPVLMLYPVIQKHFVKGVMIGAVKG
ncbi:MAG: carbohydrate ABC transporter permease [Clostridia bacterium]|nr:carbohydrate ABC transporter permease [Clostridia bacterium]